MEQHGISKTRDIIYRLLQGSIKKGDLETGRQTHLLMISSGLDSVSFFGDHLIRMYASCNNLQEANQVFCNLPKPSIYTWNAIISAHVKVFQAEKALELYYRMQGKGRKPSRVTVLCILKACSNAHVIEQGRSIHDQIIRIGLNSDINVGNALVDMYTKCGSLKEAYIVFDKLQNQDVVSWGAIICGYAQHGQALEAIRLFGRMQQEDWKPNDVIFLCILKAFCSIQALDQGRLIHVQATMDGFESDVIIGSALIDMYAKCGSLEEARRVFDKMPRQNLVTWGAMIAGYVQHGDDLVALELFEIMKQKRRKPDKVMCSCILKACCSIGAIVQGRLIHAHIISSGLELDLVLGNTLVDMYARCGSLEEICQVFGDLPNRDGASWGAMIAGLARYGSCRLAVEGLKDMQCEGIKPSNAIFTSILTAYSNAGLSEEGQMFFNALREDNGITLSLEHYNCMIELLGRAGWLEEAEHLLQTMPIHPDITGWTSLLTSCRTYGNTDIGRRCFSQTAQLDPDDASGYMLMSSIFMDSQMSDTADKIQNLRKRVGASKKLGRAWIEINKKMTEFVVGGDRYPQNDDIYEQLERLCKEMKGGEYVPRLDLVLETCDPKVTTNGRTI